MFFIPLPILLLELLIFTTFVHFYNFWDVFFAYLAPSFIGAVMFSLMGRSMLMSLQTGMNQGQLPGDRVLHKGALLLGSILLIIPLFLTRVFALFLILPIFRHISVFVFKTYIFKRMTRSPFSFVHFGGGFPGGGGFEQTYQSQSEPRQERDAEVVDVTPLEITHTKITDPKK